MQESSIDKLKQGLINYAKKYGDNICLRTKKSTYTGNEIALELENETEAGLELFNSIILLAVDLIIRNKEHI